jgi:hypothetical protein
VPPEATCPPSPLSPPTLITKCASSLLVSITLSTTQRSPTMEGVCFQLIGVGLKKLSGGWPPAMGSLQEGGPGRVGEWVTGHGVMRSGACMHGAGQM